jgi:ABC-type lipoprotein export system ATPase subunit
MLKLINLSKSFGKKQILKDFSYTFNDHGIYVIKGESGIGKTTLLRIISGLDKNYSGKVVGGGLSNVSYCFQEYRLFDTLNALQNVTEIAFDKASESDVERSAQMLIGLGFSNSELSLTPSELSGGMKQRVAFVRALMKDSPILILDEPTKEVDAKIREKMKRIIQEASLNRLILMVTHNDDDTSGLETETINL